MSAIIVPYQEEMNEEVRAIFFESSEKKTFADATEKENFYQKYLGFYLASFPQYALVAKSQQLLGYVVAAPFSQDEKLLSLQPHLRSFRQYFDLYPAHLHINCHESSRGKGIGSSLIHAIEGKLRNSGVSGLHIITANDARNQSFYKKLGYSFEVDISSSGPSLKFMGKRL